MPAGHHHLRRLARHPRSKWKDLLAFFFDPSQARALGLNPPRCISLFFTLLAATAVAALQTVGACLVVAMVVTPGATAYLLTDRFGRMLGIAVAIGVVTSCVGAYASYFLDGSTGGCIVTLQTLLFLTAFVFAPKHGMLAAAPPPASADDEGSADEPLWTLLVPLPTGSCSARCSSAVWSARSAPCSPATSCSRAGRSWATPSRMPSCPAWCVAYVLGLPLALGAFASGLLCASPPATSRSAAA